LLLGFNLDWTVDVGVMLTPVERPPEYRMLILRQRAELHQVQYNTIQYNTIQYNTIQYNAMQYNTIQYNTIQYNTVTSDAE
jgi:hypothetical protein